MTKTLSQIFHRWEVWCVTLVACIGSFIIYFPALQGQFVFDDQLYVQRSVLRDPTYLPKLFVEGLVSSGQSQTVYRPLTVASMALNFQIFGDSPLSFHSINIFLHAGVVILLYFLTKSLFKNRTVAIISSFLFLTLPIHTENVAYIKARDDLLSTVFILGSWIYFHRSMRHSQGWKFIGISWIGYALALLSKELVVLVPVGMFAAEWLLHKESEKDYWRRIRYPAVGFLGVFVGYGLLRSIALGQYTVTPDVVNALWNPLINESHLVRIGTAGKLLYLYIQKTFFPYNLSATYTYNHVSVVQSLWSSPEAIVGLILFVSLLVCVVHTKLRRTMIGVGALLFLLSYVLVSKVFFQAAELFAERWMYLPSIGIIWGLTYVLFVHIRSKKLLYGICSVLCITYGYTTFTRSFVWRSQRTLAESMIHDAPGAMYGHFMLATVEYNGGDLDKASQLLDKASSIYDAFAPLQYTRGRVAFARGEYEEALQLFVRATTLAPKDTKIHEYVALSLMKLKRYEDSLQYVQAYAKAHPEDPQTQFIVGVSLYKLGLKEEAKKYLPFDEKAGKFLKEELLDSF